MTLVIWVTFVEGKDGEDVKCDVRKREGKEERQVSGVLMECTLHSLHMHRY